MKKCEIRLCDSVCMFEHNREKVSDRERDRQTDRQTGRQTQKKTGKGGSRELEWEGGRGRICTWKEK